MPKQQCTANQLQKKMYFVLWVAWIDDFIYYKYKRNTGILVIDTVMLPEHHPL